MSDVHLVVQPIDLTERKYWMPWREAYTDKVTHWAWKRSARLNDDRYTLCLSTWPRRHYEGQAIAGALVTCLWCVAAYHR